MNSEGKLADQKGNSWQGKKNEGGLRVQGSLKNREFCNDEADGFEDKPLITVITAVFNGAGDIEQTIQSVISQTYNNIEYIIIDGGSSDGTIDIIRKHEGNIDYWISETDSGIYDAWNKGISLSNGEYIGFVGSGDYYEHDAIEHVVETILKTMPDVVYGDVAIVDAETGFMHKRKSRVDLMPKTMSSISLPSTFVKRSIYLSHHFDQSMRIASDYNLFLGLYVRGFRFEHAKATIANILTGGVSSTFRTKSEVYKVHKKYYGRFYALSQYIQGASRFAFYASRRSLLEFVLPHEIFAAARTRWLKYKYKKHASEK